MTDPPPLIAGMADPLAAGADCGCCEGIAVATPRPVENRPGLPAVSYRPGRFVDFRTSQLARLSAGERPALASLQSRENDDFTIALIDAWSCVCDVLTFYQERIANESWLGTATERLSLVELGRLIGYRPAPGVAAAAALAFTMEDPPGAPSPVASVAIPLGSRVQSVPGPDETAQTFETVETIEARIAWNDLTPRQSLFVAPGKGDSGAWLAGVDTGLKVGDAIVILGDERIAGPATQRWNFRKLVSVLADDEGDRTWVGWAPPLGLPAGDAAQSGHKFFAMRARASLFGWNAPHPELLPNPPKPSGDWDFHIDGKTIQLDSLQDGFVAGGWVALTRPPGLVAVYRIDDSVDAGRAEYAISGRGSQLTLDAAAEGDLDAFESDYRSVSVYGQSEELDFAPAPILTPVMGDRIALSGLVDGLGEGRRLVVRGRRAQAMVVAQGLALTAPGDPPETAPLTAGTRVALLSAPAPVADPQKSLWHLRAPGGLEGFLEARNDAFLYVAADESTEIVAETPILARLELDDETHSRLRLTAALAGAFDRPTTLVHANVAMATHGETTQEILGDGNGARPYQSFTLKQAPPTFVSAANETGSQSTLSVRVNDVLWHEVPALYGRNARERIFEVRTNDDSTATVQFGDGVFGARLSTGRNNVVATYRKGIGAAGNVGAGALSMALDRPLGLQDVFNPLEAQGGEDAESLDSARENAPIGTLTLGRVVSLENYSQFALGFAGIAKARADWMWDGEARRIVVTVAAPGGAALDEASGGVLDNLTRALRDLGDPFVRLTVMGFRPATFHLEGRIAVLPDYDPKIVFAAIEAALRDSYGFERRGFARLVASSEILATIQQVPGVGGVDIDKLYRSNGPGSTPILHTRLLAGPVSVGPGNTLLAAEILTLHPGPLVLGMLQ
jgi:hypothetical protein